MVLFCMKPWQLYICAMKKQIFQSLAKMNKVIFPSLAKKQLDMSKANKFQMAIIGWRYFVTKNSLN